MILNRHSQNVGFLLAFLGFCLEVFVAEHSEGQFHLSEVGRVVGSVSNFCSFRLLSGAVGDIKWDRITAFPSIDFGSILVRMHRHSLSLSKKAEGFSFLGSWLISWI